MQDARKKEIYRQLQNKGFAMPQIQCAEYLISDEANHKHFCDSLLVCENCSLGCNFSGEKVLGMGPITSPVMIVGDFAKDDDEETGVPMSGTPGHYLTMALQVLGIDRRSVYITNAIKCKSYASPNPDQLATCRPYLDYEINRVRPKYVITLGSTALKCVINNFEAKISQLRGSILSTGQMTVYPTWHPDYLLKLNGMDYKKASDEFIFDLNNAFQDIKKEYPNYRWTL